MKLIKYKSIKVVVSSIVFLVMPIVAFAGPVIRSGESVSVEAGQVVEGDFYGAGESVVISGEMNGDVYVMGGTVTINAPIAMDVAILGGTVQVHAPVADDLRVVGGEVILADVVEGDVVVVSSVLRVLSTAKIQGDILFMGNKIIIDGPVEGSLFGHAKRIRIDSSIGGNVQVTAEEGLVLGDKAEILGDITYNGDVDIVRGQGAVVVGNIQKDTIVAKGVPTQILIIPFLTMLFGALVLLLVLKPSLQTLVVTTEKSYGMQGLVGLAMLLVLPFIGIVLLFSILGLFIGLILLVVYVALLLIAWISTGIVIGTFLMRMVHKKLQVNIVTAVVGVVCFEAILFIPLIGPLLAFAIFIIVFGGIVTSVYKNIV